MSPVQTIETLRTELTNFQLLHADTLSDSLKQQIGSIHKELEQVSPDLSSAEIVERYQQKLVEISRLMLSATGQKPLKV